uniref:Nucleolar protein 16 n=1 Tax=Strongyloides stercoralis TaxID=6248 RepID=A0A0K0EPI3_STRER
MSKVKVRKNNNNYNKRKKNNNGKIVKQNKILHNPLKFAPPILMMPQVLDKPKRIIKNGVRKLVLPKDVKTKLFENLRGKHLKVDQNQLNELIKRGVDMNIDENILGFQPILMLKQRYKELCKIYCEDISKCVKGVWFGNCRYGATFLPPGHF